MASLLLSRYTRTLTPQVLQQGRLLAVSGVFSIEKVAFQKTCGDGEKGSRTSPEHLSLNEDASSDPVCVANLYADLSSPRAVDSGSAGEEGDPIVNVISWIQRRRAELDRRPIQSQHGFILYISDPDGHRRFVCQSVEDAAELSERIQAEDDGRYYCPGETEAQDLVKRIDAQACPEVPDGVVSADAALRNSISVHHDDGRRRR